MQSVLLYVDQPIEAMHQVIDIIFFNIGSTEVLNFENIYIIFHFLMPLKADIFLALILRKVKSCKIDCFTTVNINCGP